MNTLTKVTAIRLAMQEFGLSNGLKEEPCCPEGYFRMHIGNLCVRIHHDHLNRSEHIILELHMQGGRGILRRLYDPETLQEDIRAEMQATQENEKQRLYEWIQKYGADFCHAQIDRIWSEA